MGTVVLGASRERFGIPYAVLRGGAAPFALRGSGVPPGFEK